jgi:hypothetical protein
MSSLANGQGDNAVHGLLRYKLRREERRAAGFAELLREIDAVSGAATQWGGRDENILRDTVICSSQNSS